MTTTALNHQSFWQLYTRTAIDVIAKKNDGVACPKRWSKFLQKFGKRRQVSVNVADQNGCQKVQLVNAMKYCLTPFILAKQCALRNHAGFHFDPVQIQTFSFDEDLPARLVLPSMYAPVGE